MVAFVPILASAAAAKLIDFGLSKLFGSGEAAQAGAEIVGSLRDPLVSAITADINGLSTRQRQERLAEAANDPNALRTRELATNS